VQDLAPGVYHYSAIDHNLGLIAAPPLPPAALLLAGQSWADEASVIIFMIANFDRTWWKYKHPNSYRVVLIEAGHIGQNILLTATALGLGGTPTCAISEAAVEALLQLNPYRQAVVYAVALGRLPGK
jgi:SagB-type dehydrogenase family enzyme